MSDILYERVTDGMLGEMREFCRVNWGGEHPLINNREVFDFYYRDGDDIKIVAAYKPEEEIPVDFLRHDTTRVKPMEFFGVCGFIKTNSDSDPDVYISYILSKKGAPFGLSFSMIRRIIEITNARTVSCNNIRKKTRGIYDFMEYAVRDMTQWYRLNENIDSYTLCDVPFFNIFPTKSRDIPVTEISSDSELLEFSFSNYKENRPHKDFSYVKKRYFGYPFHSYRVFCLSDAGKEALLVLREIECKGARMLRVVDFIGERSLIKESGAFLDRFMKQRGAEFVDWYAYGELDEAMEHAGFSVRYPDDSNIIPMYYTPFLLSNVDITIFVSSTDGYMMFRADGDQDRPNLG